MLLLIDAYNLLRYHKTVVSKQEKQAFVAQLRRYATSKGHSIILVFDGGSFAFPTQEVERCLTIVHSGYKKSADDWLKDFMYKHTGQQNILLISTDRELRSAAQHTNLNSMTAEEFFKLLQIAPKQKEIIKDMSIHKISEESNDELDQLMTQAVHRPIDKDKDVEILRERTNQQLSKKEKKRQSLLKKL